MPDLKHRKTISSPPVIDPATGWLIRDGSWVTAQDVRTTLGAVYAPEWQRMCAAAGVTPVKREGMPGEWVALADARRLTRQRAPPSHPGRKARQVP